jgi:hypothetical protein
MGASAGLRYNESVSTAAASPDDLYFVSPLVDALFVGVLSIACFAFLRLTQSGYAATQVSGSTLWLAGALSWVANWPHFSATSLRLYESRENVRRFRLTAVAIPFFVLFATIASFWYPVSFAPYFVKLFVLWSPYHYSAQTLGFTLIYARRANLFISRTARGALTAFFVSSFLARYAETENALRTGFLYAVAYPQVPLPLWAPSACEAVMYASLALLAFEILPEIRKGDRLPWIVALPIATQYLWYVVGAPTLSFQVLVPFFHSLQYLLIAWSVEMHARASRGAAFSALFGSARWFALNVLLGGTLFWGVPRLLALRGWNLDFSIVMIAGAVSLHHYFVDGVIWKLKREGGKSPLFLNVSRAFGGAR